MTLPQRLNTLLVLSLLTVFSACQWGGDGTDEEEVIIDEGGNDSDINIDIDTEAGDIFDTESTLYEFTLINFIQDELAEKNSRYRLYFNNFAGAESSVNPDDDEDQSNNDLGLSQSSWVEDLFIETYEIRWLDISNPYNSPASHYALIRPHQSLHIEGDNSGELGPEIHSRNFPLIEAIKDNIFEHHLGASFIWDLNGLGDRNKKEDLSLDKFEDYEIYADTPLLKHASIWGDGERFSEGAKLYSGIKKINSERIVVESLLDNGNYSMSAASFDGTGQVINDIPTTYDNAGTSRLLFTYTLNFIDQHEIYLSFNAANSTAFYHLDSSSSAIASSSYSIDNNLNSLSLNTQNLTSLPTAGTSQSDLLEQLSLTSFFNLAVVGPYADANSAIKFYVAKHFIASTPDNSAKQKPVFYFNPQAYEDIQTQFFEWRDDLLNNAY